MPAHPPLPDGAPQAHADAATHADELRRAGRHTDAVVFLTGVIRDLELLPERVPAWPYGRLALLYRHLREYDDEVRVLERYQTLVPDGTHRSRFAARLSKARALADRQFSGAPAIRMRA
jgi:hypothetical protein